MAELSNQVGASGQQGFLWCDLAVGLHSELEFSKEWMRNLDR